MPHSTTAVQEDIPPQDDNTLPTAVWPYESLSVLIPPSVMAATNVFKPLVLLLLVALLGGPVSPNQGAAQIPGDPLEPNAIFRRSLQQQLSGALTPYASLLSHTVQFKRLPRGYMCGPGARQRWECRPGTRSYWGKIHESGVI